MKYLTDRKRHLICVPYTVENLHLMAELLSIKRCWYHSRPYPHYDIPLKRISEIEDKCEIVRPRDIVRIAKGEAALDHLALLTPYHINNLETLAAFLESNEIPPPQFHIGSYMKVTANDYGLYLTVGAFASAATKEAYAECGTTACAVGHGPLAGIPALDNETWHSYCYRVFGVTTTPVPYDGSGDETEKRSPTYDYWCFMFGNEWKWANNSAKGSAARIRWFLEHGVPDGEYNDNGFFRANYAITEFPWLEGIQT